MNKEDILTEKNIKKPTFLGHKIVSPLLENIPSSLKIPIIKPLKKIKQLFAREIDYKYEILDGFKNWDNKKFAIAITHDVDDLECYKNIPKIIELENQYNIKSTWFFVPYSKQYELDLNLIKELEKKGFEIALHGYNHDYDFASKNEKEIEEKLKLALKKLGKQNIGFRTPGLSRSIKLIKILNKLNFLYDSTYPDFDRYSNGGVKTCYPYIFPGTNILEIPLSYPSDADMLNMNLNNDQAFELCKKRIQMIKDLQGVYVFLFHPQNFNYYNLFYEKLLKHISEQKDALITTPREIAQRIYNTT